MQTTENLHMVHSGSVPGSSQSLESMESLASLESLESLVLDAQHWVHQLIVDMH